MQEQDVLVVATFIDGQPSSTRVFPIGRPPSRLAIGYVLDEAGPNALGMTVQRYFESGADAKFENVHVKVRRVLFAQVAQDPDSFVPLIDKVAARVPSYKPQPIQ